MFHKKRENPAFAEYETYLKQIASKKAFLYIRNRVLEQIKWYNRHSMANQRLYKITMVLSMALSALIPIFTLLLDTWGSPAIKIIIITLSGGVTALSTLNALYHFRELWIQYRTNCELLKSVLHQYFTRCGEFHALDENTMFERLVSLCEAYILNEFKNWVSKIPVYENNSHSETKL